MFVLPQAAETLQSYHGTSDATMPIDTNGRAAAAAIKQVELKEYQGAPHGLIVTYAGQLNHDLVEFLSG